MLQKNTKIIFPLILWVLLGFGCHKTAPSIAVPDTKADSITVRPDDDCFSLRLEKDPIGQKTGTMDLLVNSHRYYLYNDQINNCSDFKFYSGTDKRNYLIKIRYPNSKEGRNGMRALLIYWNENPKQPLESENDFYSADTVFTSLPEPKFHQLYPLYKGVIRTCKEGQIIVDKPIPDISSAFWQSVGQVYSKSCAVAGSQRDTTICVYR